MSTVPARRRRLRSPQAPSGEIHLEPPPELPRRNATSELIADTRAVVVVLAALAGVVSLVAGRGHLPLLLVGVALVVVATAGALSGIRRNRREVSEDRLDFDRYLGQMRDTVRAHAHDQRAALNWRHPPSAALWSYVGTPRMWDRRTGDADFAQVRVAAGNVRLSPTLVPPQTGPVEELEPMSTMALRRFVRRYSLLPDTPISVSLTGFAGVYLRGDEEACRALARTMLCSIAVTHGPDDVRIAVVAGQDRQAEWDWVKWLPHTLDHRRVDGAGPARFIVGSFLELERLLRDDLNDRQRFTRNAPLDNDKKFLVVLVDGADPTSEQPLWEVEEGLVGMSVLALSGPDQIFRRRGLRLDVAPGLIEALSATGSERFGVPDLMHRNQAEALARQLAPYRVPTEGDNTPAPVDTGTVADLLGLPDPAALDVDTAWAPRGERDRLRIPLGWDGQGTAAELDLKPDTGMGPHGLVVGDAGTGKSELLRSIVVELAATHSPDEVTFLFIGGDSVFGDFADLPHTTSIVPDLEFAGVSTVVTERLCEALAGEAEHRRVLLGDHPRHADYLRDRALRGDLPPLPSLVVVIDRFDLVVSTQSAFRDQLVDLASAGRALGIHLLLAMRDSAINDLGRFDSLLSYRISTKTASAANSRAVLGVPDAYELQQGAAVLAHQSRVTRLRMPWKFATTRAKARRVNRGVVPFDGRHVPVGVPAGEAERERLAPVAVLVDRLRDRAPKARPIWTPPLTEAADLSALLGELRVDPEHGLRPVSDRYRGGLVVPIGTVDDLKQHRHGVHEVDLAASLGGVLVVGEPGSGRSTVLRTLVCALALTHAPRSVRFSFLDMSSDGVLRALTGLPHVGGIATRQDVDQVSRIVADARATADRRADLFFRIGIDSMAEYRTRRAAGEFPDDPTGDVVLVVHDWARFADNYRDAAETVLDLARRGIRYGVYLVVSTSDWAQVPRELGGARQSVIELRLADPRASNVNPRLAARVPERRSGHGLTGEGMRFLAALPRVDGRTSVDDTAVGLTRLITAVRDAWHGPPAPRIRAIPDHVSPADLPEGEPLRVPVGIGGVDVSPLWVDFTAAPHFLVYGDRGSGKTTLLRHLERAAVAGGAEVVDAATAVSLRHELAGRRAGEWSGPRYFVVVDDYDTLVPPGSVSPLRTIADLLPDGGRIGLHLVIARRAEGAAEANYETVLAALHDMRTPGVVLSGNETEGALLAAERPDRRSPGRGVLVDHDGTSHAVQLVSL